MTLSEGSSFALEAALKNATANAEIQAILDALPATVSSSIISMKIGRGATDKLGFFGLATPIVRRDSADQAAVTTTGATSTTPFGYSEAQANAIVTLVNELRASLVAYGLIKGAA
jgi:hypothetical protein